MLSPATISSWIKSQKSVGTNTPKELWKIITPICSCQKIPLINLEYESSSKYNNKSTSTRCTCKVLTSQLSLMTQTKEPSNEVQNQIKNKHHQKQSIPDFSSRPRYRNVLGNVLQGSESLNKFATSSSTYSCSDVKEGPNSTLYNTLPLNNSSFNFKRALYRKPLVVVKPIAAAKEIRNLTMDQPLTILPKNKSTPSIKVNFSRSILDAIKWYTKHDPTVCSTDTSNDFPMKEGGIIVYDDGSQENMKPIPKITLANSCKAINYFDVYVDNKERDYCFERSFDGTSKLVTRRGGRHYVNREPCPSCFQGRDSFCVYEFIRQAKLAGVSLQKNQKPLQIMFLKFVEAEKSEA